MKEFIKWKEEEMFIFTNYQVDRLKEKIETGRSYELTKALFNHIEVYKTIIDNLLENENKNK